MYEKVLKLSESPAQWEKTHVSFGELYPVLSGCKLAPSITVDGVKAQELPFSIPPKTDHYYLFEDNHVAPLVMCLSEITFKGKKVKLPWSSTHPMHYLIKSALQLHKFRAPLLEGMHFFKPFMAFELVTCSK